MRSRDLRFLWSATVLFPVIAALVMAGAFTDYEECAVPDETAMEMFSVALLGFPLASAILGYLAGWGTFREEGWVAHLAGVGATILSLIWGAISYWLIFVWVVDSACP